MKKLTGKLTLNKETVKKLNSPKRGPGHTQPTTTVQPSYLSKCC